ncbi:hypothetical protein LEP1GSC170_3831 [Leptospira interrogans serovar Bataviae str. HAI135]|nr:hypothetical protein LEP1GSC170_3831 [Leptospira interrogans serovar Bataviae str. HAI135]
MASRIRPGFLMSNSRYITQELYFFEGNLHPQFLNILA